MVEHMSKTHHYESGSINVNKQYGGHLFGAPIVSLKLPSLFAASLFFTFLTKSYNMKPLVILSHSCSTFLSLTCLYGNNELLWVSLQPSGVFSEEKYPPRLPMQIA